MGHDLRIPKGVSELEIAKDTNLLTMERHDLCRLILFLEQIRQATASATRRIWAAVRKQSHSANAAPLHLETLCDTKRSHCRFASTWSCIVDIQ